VQVKSEAHDKELYQKFKQDIDNEVADMRDLLRQNLLNFASCSFVICPAFAPKVAITSTANINFFILFSPFLSRTTRQRLSSIS
jgi:hypothetical protein